jgi:hypothetical protein
MARLNELIRQLPAETEGKVHVVDLASWVTSTGEDRRLRTDGVHFGQATALEVAERFLGGAILDTYQQAWRTRAAAGGVPGTPDDPADDAAVPTDQYLKTKYRALVVGDARAKSVAEGMAEWGKKTGALTVETAITPQCGFLKVVGRQAPDGTRAPPPKECDNAVFGALQRTAASKPDFVVVVPPAWDLAPVQLTPDGPWVSWDDEAFHKNASTQYAQLAQALNKGRAIAQFVTPASSERPSDLFPTIEARRAAGFDSMVRSLVYLSKDGIERIAFGRWAESHLPALREGAEITPTARTEAGDWFGREAYIRYDGGTKLRTPGS